MLVGEKLYLRLMEEQDIPFKVKWINDPKIRATLNFDYPISQISTRQWLTKVAADSSRKDFIACLRENDEPVGYGGFLNIDIRNSKAESYLGIGNVDYWGKGLAYQMRMLLLEYAFLELGLNKVYTYNWPENTRIVKLNERAGFTIEGRLRDDIFSHGERRDRLVMGLLRKDYLANRGNSQEE